MNSVVLECGCHKVHSNGSIYSRLIQFSKKGKRGIQTKRSGRWRKLSGTKTKAGYLQARIHGRTVRIHRIIAANFIPNPMCYPEAQHKNGVPTDNRVANLKWGTALHNAADRETHGKSIHGSKSPLAKLKEKDVLEIRQERARKSASLNCLARKFNVSKKLIFLIDKRKIWKHI